MERVDGLHGIARLSFVTARMEIRPGSDADLAALVAVLGQRHFFTDRLARQQGGGGVLLVAWLGGRPVGDGFLVCEPAEEPKVRRHLPGVPQLTHLEVLGPLQGRGSGTALIRAAEDTARQLGHEQLALGVGLVTRTLGGCMSGSGMWTGAKGLLWGPGWSATVMGRR